jgi:hypothetical protein
VELYTLSQIPGCLLTATSYYEAISLFYSSLTFHVYSGPTLRRFINAVPSQYLASVRNVWFDWCLGGKELPHTSPPANLAYNKVWDGLRSFSGLRVLCVTIESRLDHQPLPADMQLERIGAWLRPLEKFSDLDRCDITVGEEFQEVFGSLKKAPYRILEADRALNKSTGKPYRSCRSCGTTHGSVSNNPEWVGGNAS